MVGLQVSKLIQDAIVYSSPIGHVFQTSAVNGSVVMLHRNLFLGEFPRNGEFCCCVTIGRHSHPVGFIRKPPRYSLQPLVVNSCHFWHRSLLCRHKHLLPRGSSYLVQKICLVAVAG